MRCWLLTATTMADLRFMQRAEKLGLTASDMEVLFDRASGAPISEAQSRVGAVYANKMATLKPRVARA